MKEGVAVAGILPKHPAGLVSAITLLTQNDSDSNSAQRPEQLFREAGASTLGRRIRGFLLKGIIFTLGVLSTNFCFPSSGPICAFSFSSFANSSSICGGKVGAELSRLPLPSLLSHSFSIPPPSESGADLSPQAQLRFSRVLPRPPADPGPDPPYTPGRFSHIFPLCRPPSSMFSLALLWPLPCHLGRTCSALAFCCLRPRTRSPWSRTSSSSAARSAILRPTRAERCLDRPSLPQPQLGQLPAIESLVRTPREPPPSTTTASVCYRKCWSWNGAWGVRS